MFHIFFRKKCLYFLEIKKNSEKIFLKRLLIIYFLNFKNNLLAVFFRSQLRIRIRGIYF